MDSSSSNQKDSSATPTTTTRNPEETQVATLDKIDPAIANLVARSVSARNASYSPYSKFSVGAALLCEDGNVVIGCNVENSSFPATVCAETTAVVKAVSEGHKKFVAIAVCGVMEDTLVAPCGICRQVLAEFNPRIKIYLHNSATDKVRLTSLDHLLPESFNPETASLACL